MPNRANVRIVMPAPGIGVFRALTYVLKPASQARGNPWPRLFAHNPLAAAAYWGSAALVQWYFAQYQMWPAARAAILSLGNTIAPILAAELVRARIRKKEPFARVIEALSFALCAFVDGMIAATMGATTIWTQTSAPLRALPTRWFEWTLSDAGGCLLLAPLLLLAWAWSTFRHYATGCEGRGKIESEWTEQKRERAAGRLCPAVALPHSSQTRA